MIQSTLFDNEKLIRRKIISHAVSTMEWNNGSHFTADNRHKHVCILHLRAFVLGGGSLNPKLLVAVTRGRVCDSSRSPLTAYRLVHYFDALSQNSALPGRQS